MERIVQKIMLNKAALLTSQLNYEIGGGNRGCDNSNEGGKKNEVCREKSTSTEKHERHESKREERRNELRNKYKLKGGMDKLTQAMLKNKSAYLTSKLREETGREFEHGTKDETRIRNHSLRELREHKKSQMKEITKTHRESEIAREKKRSVIREKYQLRGSTKYNGSYESDIGHSHSGDSELRNKSTKCSIQ